MRDIFAAPNMFADAFSSKAFEGICGQSEIRKLLLIGALHATLLTLPGSHALIMTYTRQGMTNDIKRDSHQERDNADGHRQPEGRGPAHQLLQK